MPVMNDQEKQTGPVEDHRSKPRWSANKKMDSVLRLLRGEPLDQPSRELGVEAHRLAAFIPMRAARRTPEVTCNITTPVPLRSSDCRRTERAAPFLRCAGCAPLRLIWVQDPGCHSAPRP